MLSEKDEMIANAELIRHTLCGNADLEREQDELQREMTVLVEMTQNCVAENARTALDQDEYQKRYNGLVKRYEKAKAKYDAVTAAIADNLARNELLGGFIRTLEKEDGLIAEFDERLWCSLVDCIMIYSREDIRVIFRNGTEISTEM